ncbi:MAG: cobyrinate a,c-diamide synthase [Hyphomicrobiales bacterium]
MAETPRGLVVAAPSSGSGKTLITLGLLRALRHKGVAVSAAKAGPDYIDPRFHEAAVGAPCINLDPWAMRPEFIRELASSSTGLFVAEGVMGLFDGTETGEGSTADLAAHLNLPVVTVMDVQRQAQTVAAVLAGLMNHRKECRIVGVIFNRVGTPRHAALLEAAVKPLGIPVLGSIANDRNLEVPSRHLGLVQASEHPQIEGFLEHAATVVTGSIDLEALCALAEPIGDAGNVARLQPLGQRIAIARDQAFAFAYQHVLDGWQKTGAEILPFSPLADEAPDTSADAIYLPGGYPELHGGKIAANGNFLKGLRDAAQAGTLIYGECGGYMVLGDGLTDADGARHQMAGLLKVETSFAKRKLHLGYRELKHENALPLPSRLRGHEFHYSTLLHQGAGEPLFTAHDAAGRELGAMGLRRANVMGSYAHIIDIGAV